MWMWVWVWVRQLFLFLFLEFVGLGVSSTIPKVADGIWIRSSTHVVLGTGSSTSDVDIVYEFVITVYKNGPYKKLDDGPKVPAGINATNVVWSKDVVIRQDTGVNARLYKPKDYQIKGEKLPVLVYLHGGGFCAGNAAAAAIHQFVSTIFDKANVTTLSVKFRVPPNNYLPVAYDDSWEAVKWLANHVTTVKGTEHCLTKYVNFSRVFIAGDSSGANISHNVAMWFGSERLFNVVILFSPYFVPKTPTPSMINNITGLWYFLCPTTSGSEDPRVNPMTDPKLASICCEKVLINVAEFDPSVDAGKLYADALQRITGKSVEIFEIKGKRHDHQLREMDMELMDRVTRFLNS